MHIWVRTAASGHDPASIWRGIDRVVLKLIPCAEVLGEGWKMVRLKVNGVEQSFGDEPEMLLLWCLRDVLELTGPEFGCGIGLCGACTVDVNGQAGRSFVTTMADAAGRGVTRGRGSRGEPMACSSGGLDGNQCAAMWLLPVNSWHNGGGSWEVSQNRVIVTKIRLAHGKLLS